MTSIGKMTPRTLTGQCFCGAVAYTVVMRAVRRAGGPTRRAEQVLRSIALVPVDQAILREAATLTPVSLRSLDAVHLAAALELMPASVCSKAL